VHPYLTGFLGNLLPLDLNSYPFRIASTNDLFVEAINVFQVDFTFQKYIISGLGCVPRLFAPSPALQLLNLWKSVKLPYQVNCGETDFEFKFLAGENGKPAQIEELKKTVMRRRTRQADPLASASAINEVIEQLRERCPELIPASERGLFRLMNAVRHIERHPASLARSGRPGHFPREKLLEVARHLKAVLAKRYRDRISPSTFIGFCLPILKGIRDRARFRKTRAGQDGWMVVWTASNFY
jgi:hypothetical protein